MGHRLWLSTVAIHRLGVVEIAPSPHHCFRTAHPCAQSVKSSPTEPVLFRSSRQRLGHLQSHVDGGWHVCQAVFPEPQSAAARRRVEQRDCAQALPRLQSASSWSVMEQLVPCTPTSNMRVFNNIEASLTSALNTMATHYDSNQLRAHLSKTHVCAFHLRNREAKRELNGVERYQTLKHNNLSVSRRPP